MDLYGLVTPTWAGARVDAEARLHENVMGFVEGFGGLSNAGGAWVPDYGVLGGVRVRW